jgi:hypothetical protein
MANATVNAGGQGVAGTVDFATRTRTGAYGSTYTDNGNLAVSDNHAVRRSVARTSRANPGTASGVFSETQGLRMGYPGVEADSPALDASRTAV